MLCVAVFTISFHTELVLLQEWILDQHSEYDGILGRDIDNTICFFSRLPNDCLQQQYYVSTFIFI